MSFEMEEQAVTKGIRRNIIASAFVSFLLLAAIGVWATVANLSSAIVASGHFVVSSYVKQVQHPTGGVVGEILVQEGDPVVAGDIVMRLDATQTRANLAIVTKRLNELTARLARLVAEREDEPEIAFPDELFAGPVNDELAATFVSEKRLFEARAAVRQSKRAQLEERIVQYRHEIEGLKAQEVAYADGLTVLQAEISNLADLRRQGVVSDQRLNNLKTQAATFGGERGEKIAYQAQVAGRIAEARLQILQIDQDLKSEVGRELREVQAQIGEFVERKVAAEDELRRIDIVAPQSGVVHELAVHTVGGVISPAETIMAIVPDTDSLALEVRVSPIDIDQVIVGQSTQLRLSAFNLRTTPELEGHVSRVAADITKDEETGMSFYLVRISVPDEELAKLSTLALIPGMPAEAFIRTGDRTALSYLLKPLNDQLNRAFREE